MFTVFTFAAQEPSCASGDADGGFFDAVTSPQEIGKSGASINGNDDGVSLGDVMSPQEIHVSDDAQECSDAVTSPQGVAKQCAGELGAMPKFKAKRPAKAKQAPTRKVRKTETKTGASATPKEAPKAPTRSRAKKASPKTSPKAKAKAKASSKVKAGKPKASPKAKAKAKGNSKLKDEVERKLHCVTKVLFSTILKFHF